ncbi:hypothetical protein CP061683_0284B, partial [Chlamydia psittaci 06-1683]
SKLFLKGNTIA